MIRKRKFIWQMDHDMGTAGWVPIHNLDFDVTLTIGTAHDVMEHFNAKDSTVEEECMAFGCMLWGRGQDGWFQHNRPYTTRPQFYQNALGDVADFLAKAGMQVAPTKAYRIEDWAEHELTLLHREVLPELQDYWGVFNDGDMPDPAPVLANTMHWIRKGYRKAEKTYSPFVSCSGFCQIFDMIQTHEYVAHGADFIEGDVLTVSADFARIRVDMDVRHTR